MRGFKVAKGFEETRVNLPRRMTTNAAGYDFEAVESQTILPIWGHVFQGLKNAALGTRQSEGEKRQLFKPTLVKTGVKAYMGEDEALMLYNRSSNPIKHLLLLSNGVGVIDSDYYENEDNDGHIMFQFINLGFWPVHIRRGDRIGQGVFQKFLLADGDVPGKQRTGGHGHTNN